MTEGFLYGEVPKDVNRMPDGEKTGIRDIVDEINFSLGYCLLFSLEILRCFVPDRNLVVVKTDCCSIWSWSKNWARSRIDSCCERTIHSNELRIFLR